MDPDEWLAWIDALSLLRETPPWMEKDQDFEFLEFVAEWYRELIVHPSGTG